MIKQKIVSVDEGMEKLKLSLPLGVKIGIALGKQFWYFVKMLNMELPFDLTI